jgi:hypothetical protein
VLTSDLYITFNIKHLTDPELTRFDRTFEHFMHLYLQIIPITAWSPPHNQNMNKTITELSTHYKVQLEKIKTMTSDKNFTEKYQKHLQDILVDDKIAANVYRQLVCHYIYCKMPYYVKAINNTLCNAFFYTIARNIDDKITMLFYQANNFNFSVLELNNTSTNIMYQKLTINRHRFDGTGTRTEHLENRKLVASKAFVDEVIATRKSVYGEEPDLYIPGLLTLDNLLQRFDNTVSFG